MSSPVTPAAAPRTIDLIRAHFSSKLVPVEVPEWGLTLWFGPLTMADFEVVSVTAGERAEERNVRLLISKARLQDGTPAFAPGDLHYLRTEAQARVITRLVNAMYEVGAVTKEAAEEAVGNSTGSEAIADSPSGSA